MWEVAKGSSKGSSGSSPFRSYSSCDVQAGRLDHVSSGQKTLKTELILKGDYQAWVCSGQMVFVVVRQGSWTTITVAKDSRQPKDLFKNGQSDSPNKSQLALFLRRCSRGDMMILMMRWDYCACAITELCDSNTEYWGIFPQDSVFIALASYQHRGVGRDRKQMVNAILIDSPSMVLSSQLDLHSAE